MKLIEFTHIDGRVFQVNPEHVSVVREVPQQGEPYEKPTGKTRSDGSPETVTTVDIHTVTSIEAGTVRVLVDSPIDDVVKALQK